MLRTAVKPALCLLIAVCPLAGQGSPPVLGSVPYAGGVSFAVWAPNASSVFVEGDFNNWSKTATPLSAQANGVWAANVTGALAGQTYRYVISSPGFATVTRRDPYNRVVTEADYNNGNSIIYDASAYHWNSPPFTAPPLKNIMIYEMHIGTFAYPSGGGVGNFRSAIAKLPEVSSLGFNAVEVLPVVENPPGNTIGYDTSDQLAVENETYGGPDEFKAFVDACHGAGLAVILDIVHNHWGPWDLTTDQFDGWHTTDYPGGIYFYDSADWNSPFGPRPNYSSPDVAQYIYDSLTMWIAEYRIDGFRWDSVSNMYNTNSGTGTYLPDGWSLLQTANAQTVARDPAFLNIAEDLTGTGTVTQPTAQGGAGFASQWNGNFVSPMRTQLTQTSDANVNMNAVASAIGRAFNNVFTQNLNYTESHNEVSGGQRLTTLIDPAEPAGWLSLKKSTLGAAVLFTSPGVPLIFQGQEFVENEPLAPNLPLQWGLVPQFASIRKLWAALAFARANATGHTPNLTGDSVNVYQVDNTNKFIAYERFDSQSPGKVVVAANFTGNAEDNVTVGFPAPGIWITRFNSDSKTYSSTFSGVGSAAVQASGKAYSGMPYSGSLTIGPYSLMILSQQ